MMQNKNKNEFKNIFNYMKKIEYGWVDKYNKKYYTNEEFSQKYVLQNVKNMKKNKIGVCWDQVELERYLFNKKKIETETYFLVYYNKQECPTHTFLIYNNNNKFYWFEHAFSKYKGIHQYLTKVDLLNDVAYYFLNYNNIENFNIKNLKLFRYETAKGGMVIEEFYNHCENGEDVTNILDFFKKGK